jgi:hypothetical protein
VLSDDHKRLITQQSAQWKVPEGLTETLQLAGCQLIEMTGHADQDFVNQARNATIAMARKAIESLASELKPLLKRIPPHRPPPPVAAAATASSSSSADVKQKAVAPSHFKYYVDATTDEKQRSLKYFGVTAMHPCPRTSWYLYRAIHHLQHGGVDVSSLKIVPLFHPEKTMADLEALADKHRVCIQQYLSAAQRGHRNMPDKPPMPRSLTDSLRMEYCKSMMTRAYQKSTGVKVGSISKMVKEIRTLKPGIHSYWTDDSDNDEFEAD